MASYWVQRHERAKQKLTDKGINKINKQLKKYYQTCMNSVIKDFEATYDKFLAAVADGKEPTPAWLYSMDKYWQMKGQLKQELQKLGDKEAALLSKEFTEQYMSIYEASALPSDKSFSKIDKSLAVQMINQIWCADGKTWSQRIWGNIDRLQETLNESLINCVVTGKKTTELKRLLQERFGVSYRRANTLVRTEMSNIQNQAARQKYLDSGLTKYEFLGRKEGSGCGHSPDCHKLDGKKFLLVDMEVGRNAPPMHPNCRCSIAPVVFEEEEMNEEKKVTDTDKRNKELKDIASKISNGGTFPKWLKGNKGAKSLFLEQLESTSRKKIDKGVKREIKEMVADWDDSMFKQCKKCGRVFTKASPKSNRAELCPECYKVKRRADKAASKARAAEAQRQKKQEEKRKADKAEWARKYRAAQKQVKAQQKNAKI